MKINKLLTVTAVVLALTALALGAASALPIFTGSAPDDFMALDVVVVTDPVGDTPPPIGIPSPPLFPEGSISGWDVEAIYFDYESASDIMYIGIDCLGICGDADGDGDPGGTGFYLDGLGGTDLPDLGGSEFFALVMDTDNDGEFEAGEVVVGVAGGADISSFGTYEYNGLTPSEGFGDSLPNNATILFAEPSADAPDIEFSIAAFSTLPGFSFTPSEAFEFQVLLKDGSREDDGIPEETVFGKVTYNPGTGTPGYWKNHPEAWPVDEITIGGVTYTKNEAIPLMKEDKHDKTTTMFRSLVAAKLNVFIGNESSCIAETIIAADEWMATYGPVGSGVKANSDAWKEGEPLYLTLDDYNNGLLCAPSRDDLE